MTPIKIKRTGSGWSAIFRYQPDTKDYVKGFGFKFDFLDKTWKTTSATIASDLAKAIRDEQAQNLIDVQANLQNKMDAEAFDMSRGLTPLNGMAVASPPGLTYSPYQLAMIEWCLQRYESGRHNLICADEMGIGKTMEAIGLMQVIIEKHDGIPRFLIVCPASLKINWEREIRKWDLHGLTVAKVSGRKCPTKVPSENVIIINYDILINHREWISSVGWGLIVCDEAHMLKNSNTKRSVAVLGGKAKMERGKMPVSFGPLHGRKLFLTGTPMVNRPVELFPMLKECDPDGLGANWYRYVTEYCDGHQTRYGWDTKGASNLGRLQGKLRSSCMMRRRTDDVLTQLPPIRRQAIVLPDNGHADLIQREWEAYNQYEQIRAELESARSNTGDIRKLVRSLSDRQGLAWAELAEARKLVGLAKRDHVIEHVSNVEESRGKVVVFAWHRDVVETLMEGFNKLKFNPVKFTGANTLYNRQTSIDRFQDNPDVRVIVLNLEAGGVGITLTGTEDAGFCTSVVFSELDWRPSTMEQAERRVARRGADEGATNILVQHIVLDGSLDATISNRLIDKQDIIDQAIN